MIGRLLIDEYLSPELAQLVSCGVPVTIETEVDFARALHERVSIAKTLLRLFCAMELEIQNVKCHPSCTRTLQTSSDYKLLMYVDMRQGHWQDIRRRGRFDLTRPFRGKPGRPL